MRHHSGDVSPYLESPPRTLHEACHERRETAGKACPVCRIRDICEAQLQQSGTASKQPDLAAAYAVDVRRLGGDLVELMAEMRMWLDHRHIEAREFLECACGSTLALRVGFRAADDATAFAEAFSGSIEPADRAPALC